MNKPDFANISNVAYVEELYQRYLEDPASLSESWRDFFAGFQLGVGAAPEGGRIQPGTPAASLSAAAAAISDSQAGGMPIEPTIGVFALIHSYRELGHLIADLDPLGDNQTSHPLLDLAEFGFGETDLDRVFECPTFKGRNVCRLGELVELLRETYCGTLGVEYMTIQSKEQREWIQQHIEPTLNKPALADGERKKLLEQMFRADAFEQFLHRKYVGAKRFSLEGADSLVPLLQSIIDESAGEGVREIVMGMPHRGRLNVLAHVLAKPYEMMFSEFEGSFLPDSVQGDGDVKYHLGYSRDYTAPGGGQLHVSLLYNPSHLEAINPVAEGIVAGKQHYLGDEERRLVLPVLVHGDAAFMGQGLVMETLALSELPGFHTGGTIHVVVNNQIGFTTSPRDYRFTRYPTELAKLIGAPVLHVNGDDPEAVVQAARLAAAFRARFREDVMIDLVCYRRHGHNELDDPTFTQPLMYTKIRARKPARTLYAERLLAAGAISHDEVRAIEEKIQQEFETALEYARDHLPRQQVFTFGGAWKGLTWAGRDREAHTRVTHDALLEVIDRVRALPPGFAVHPKARRVYDERAQMLEAGSGIDWGCAEMLAMGTLLMEGTAVRLSGQDSGRGTFSHRHAALHDGKTGARYVPLDHMSPQQGRFYLIDSNLSEAGVLGFEYGFSSADPRNLVIWEAQFGDFANSAQVIIDQFVVSGESKWQRMNGLVLLLPHGYEGQGPEHSSARPERFLAMCAEQNIQVCNMTNPAQLFHVLRRQMHRNFRKPLVIMSPKSMLRSKLCQSRLEEFLNRDFQTVLGEPEDIPPRQVRRILLCSGKVYYDLLVGRRERRIRDVAIVRLEQLYPFPLAELREEIGRYPARCEVFWVQEEPKNMGAWRFISDRNHMIFEDGRTLTYVGRDAAASPATGSYKNHQNELRALVNNAYCPPRILALAPRRKKVHGR